MRIRSLEVFLVRMYMVCFLNGGIPQKVKLGFAVGPVIQANGRLKFEDELRSGGLLYCVSQ